MTRYHPVCTWFQSWDFASAPVISQRASWMKCAPGGRIDRVGPSSSHTMGPRRAADLFLEKHPEAAKYRIILFGSLGATGKGHLTDKAIEEAFHPRSFEIFWREKEKLPLHPNGMRFESLDSNRVVMDSWEVYSIGEEIAVFQMWKRVER